jgi:tetratricopeptide (TPR) repeat protein
VYPDLRQALDWSLEHQPRARQLALAMTLFHLWFRTGDGREAGHWGRRMLDGADDEPAGLRAAAHFVVAFSANILGDPEVAQTNVDTALRLFRESGDRSGLATALFGSCNVALMMGDIERANALAEEALEISAEGGDKWNRAGSLAILSFVRLVGGSLDEARRCAEQAASLYRDLGDVAGQVVMCPLGVILIRQGDLDAAESFAHQSAAVASGTAWEGAALVGIAEVLLARGDVDGAEPLARRGMIRALDTGVEMWFRRALQALAQVHARRGSAERAAQLLGASRRNAYAFEVDPAVAELIETHCRENLDEQTFVRANERGYDMSYEQILELAHQPLTIDPRPT